MTPYSPALRHLRAMASATDAKGGDARRLRAALMIARLNRALLCLELGRLAATTAAFHHVF